MTRYHFISGLPRSGSTLLSALLRQNPSFYANISGPLGSLFHATRNAMGTWNETSVMLTDAHRERILKGLFDTNRAWCARLSALMRLFPDARVICCVRSVAWIMDSIERLIRKHPFQKSRLFNSDTERSTVFSRVETLAQQDRFVGFAWPALKEAVYGAHADWLHLVDFDLLTAAPERVQPVRRQIVLPHDLFDRLDALSFWRDLSNSRARMIVAKREPHAAAAE